MPEKFENATITRYFGFAFSETQAGKSHDYHNVIICKKFPFQNVFRPH